MQKNLRTKLLKWTFINNQIISLLPKMILAERCSFMKQIETQEMPLKR